MYVMTNLEVDMKDECSLNTGIAECSAEQIKDVCFL